MGREQDRYGGALGHIPGQPKHAWREGLCIRLIPVLLSGWSQARPSPATEGGIRAPFNHLLLSSALPQCPTIPGALPQPCRSLLPSPNTAL